MIEAIVRGRDTEQRQHHRCYSFCAEEYFHVRGGVRGGVGCTWEHDCHPYLRRSKLLAYSLGAEGLWKKRSIEPPGIGNPKLPDRSCPEPDSHSSITIVE